MKGQTKMINMTLRELLTKLYVGNSDQYATLKARYIDKGVYVTDFTYRGGTPYTIATLLKIIPSAILDKGVIDFDFYGGNSKEYFAINEDNKIVRVPFDITIEY